tara:strand:+ start:774 stop:1310 length:537 start_codon:yes stop_codon:yes gene_type:complete
MLLLSLLPAFSYHLPPRLPPSISSTHAPTLIIMRERSFEPPPGLEPDAVILLWYYGMATVFRESAYRYQLTGLPWKRLDQLGFDLPAMSQAFGGASAIASTWVFVALLTGVMEVETRYEPWRVALTWLLAAPAAQGLKYVLHLNAGDGSFKYGDALTDGLVTLGLMFLLRRAEEEGWV